MYFRLPEDQHRRLQEIAASEHRTVSAEIRRLVEGFIAENEPEDMAA